MSAGALVAGTLGGLLTGFTVYSWSVAAQLSAFCAMGGVFIGAVVVTIAELWRNLS